jgi:hypothetical protein
VEGGGGAGWEGEGGVWGVVKWWWPDQGLRGGSLWRHERGRLLRRPALGRVRTAGVAERSHNCRTCRGVFEDSIWGVGRLEVTLVYGRRGVVRESGLVPRGEDRNCGARCWVSRVREVGQDVADAVLCWAHIGADSAQDIVPDQPYIQGLRGILGQHHQPADGSYVNPHVRLPSADLEDDGRVGGLLHPSQPRSATGAHEHDARRTFA